MIRSIQLAVACVAVLVATMGQVQAGIINSGFETGDFTGWTVGGPNGGSGVALDGTPIDAASFIFGSTFVNVRSGSFAAFGATAGTSGEILSLSQTVNLAAGTQTAGFYMGNDSGNAFGIDDAISDQRLAIFVNGVHKPFTTQFPMNNFPAGRTPATMFEFSSSFTSVGGPTLLEYRISGSGSARAGISVDDFFVNGATKESVVPEPSSIALLGMGGLTLFGYGWRRRCRRRTETSA